MILMMKRSFFSGIALGSLVLATGVPEISVNAKTSTSNAKIPTSTAKIDRQFLPTASTKLPIYIAQANTSPASVEQAVHNQVNQYRAQRGLPPLSLDERISGQARTHSQNMASGAVPFSHNGFAQRVQAIGGMITYRAAAENVAYNQGYNDPATQAVQGWLRSTGHRQNIECNYNLTGVGVARNARGEYYFTQIFIRSR